MLRGKVWLGLVLIGTLPLLMACGDAEKKTEASAQVDSADKSSKKPDAKSAGASSAAQNEAKPPEAKAKLDSAVEVPGLPGFYVPGGAEYKRVEMTVGDNVMKFESYTYPLKDFARADLHAAFKKHLGEKGWTVTPDGTLGYLATKASTKIRVAFGEAGADETKISVFPPS